MNNIKWGCIQPLTGGMYIGAMQATGCNAQWIIDYPGHSSIKYDKEGNVVTHGNEVSLLKWLEKNNCSVPVYTLDRQMFQNDDDLNPKFLSENEPDFSDELDLVIAVPVCSGLSSITIASDDTKNTRNCNMLWITKYTLNAIKPKIYIFENAPALAGDKGEPIRKELEQIADMAGYSVSYFKTDTMLHYNCQRRQRTFVMFVKYTEDVIQSAPALNFVYNFIDSNLYLSNIPNDASQQTVIPMDDMNSLLLSYMKYKFGNDWRKEHKHPYVLVNIAKGETGNIDELIEYVSKQNTYEQSTLDKTILFLQHVKEKVSAGKNFYSSSLTLYHDYTPSIQFKSLQSVMHHDEDRLFTVREALWLMGMPHDFELYCPSKANLPQIGQNVPVGTAKYICSEAVRIINSWYTVERKFGKHVMLYDNIKQIVKEYDN